MVKSAPRVALPDLTPGVRKLDASATRYLTRVHRLREGAAFIAFDPERGLEAEAELLDTERAGARCRIDSVARAADAAPARVVLLQALGKADKPERIVRDATALGAELVRFIEAQRSVPRPGERALERRQRWRRVALDAARQSGRARVPLVEGPSTLADALVDLPAGGLRLCLEPGAARTLAEMLDSVPVSDPVVVLVGPEGGFAESESEAARTAGFVPVRLGRLVLRTETAATAALGAIAARW